MSLADRLATPPAPKSGNSRFTVWVESLPKEDQEAVNKAIQDPRWRHIDLQRELEAAGAPKIAETSFGTWRRKQVKR